MDQSEKEKADLCPLLFKHRGGCVNYDHCGNITDTDIMITDDMLSLMLQHVIRNHNVSETFSK